MFSINQKLSLTIPRVFPQWVNAELIMDTFSKQDIGRISNVSIVRVPREEEKRGHPVYKAILKFSVWYQTEIAYNFQQRILTGKKQARVVYDDPWYWVVFEHKSRNKSRRDRQQQRQDQEEEQEEPEQDLEDQEEQVREPQMLMMMPMPSQQTEEELLHMQRIDRQLLKNQADLQDLQVRMTRLMSKFADTNLRLDENDAEIQVLEMRTNRILNVLEKCERQELDDEEEREVNNPKPKPAVVARTRSRYSFVLNTAAAPFYPIKVVQQKKEEERHLNVAAETANAAAEFVLSGGL
jgi:hypothetical protein